MPAVHVFIGKIFNSMGSGFYKYTFESLAVMFVTSYVMPIVVLLFVDWFIRGILL